MTITLCAVSNATWPRAGRVAPSPLCSSTRSTGAPTLEEARAGLLGVDVHAVSGECGDGVEALAPYLGPGRTVAFVGSSGVGKSTLINLILGRQSMATREVRSGDSRGRHTTPTVSCFP